MRCPLTVVGRRRSQMRPVHRKPADCDRLRTSEVCPLNRRDFDDHSDGANIPDPVDPLSDRLSTVLADVEAVLWESVDRLPEPGRSGCRRVIGAGGKRLRPEVLLRCAEVTAPRSVSAGQRAVTTSAAAAIELLHSATLLHDDLLDGSHTRRGVVTVHRREGVSAAVIGGDGLIAQSWRLIAQAGRDDVEDLAAALTDMCAGESLEDQLRFAADALPLDVLRVSQLKTGALLKAACRIGARRGGCSEAQIQALGTFGSDFGVALQLLDDVLDVLSTEELFGKPCGADFAAGTITMPAVYAMQQPAGDDVGDRGRAADELSGLLRPGLDLVGAARACSLILESGGAQRVVDRARSFARRAARAVPLLSPAARELAAMPGAYIDRQLTTKVAPEHRWMLGAGAGPGDSGSALSDLPSWGDAG